uniref:Hemopexin n=1 Tax=Myripristis murdjan TaxID=586833 RepID=A0A668A4Y5_9TELE
MPSIDIELPATQRQSVKLTAAGLSSHQPLVSAEHNHLHFPCCLHNLSCINALYFHTVNAEDGQHHDHPDRCDGIEFDAIVPDENGVTYFFKDNHLWRGFTGSAHFFNHTFKELDDHHIGHIDAAFRMHNPDSEDHDHIYFFLDDKVFSYYNHTLEEGYPKEINKVFKEIPSHLDAAVECPKGECVTDSVLFFKGHVVYTYDISTKVVKEKTWDHLPVCTSAYRWLEHHYCFHGNSFTRFNPVTGVVEGTYPKDARNYFMMCPGFGEFGLKVWTNFAFIKKRFSSFVCPSIHSGSNYMHLNPKGPHRHPFPIIRKWKEVTEGVDAVFSYTDKLYMIKGEQVYIYKSGAGYTLIEGYPKTLKEELGIDGPITASFVCPSEHTVHIIQGSKMMDVDLTATPRAVTSEVPLSISDIDAVLCDADGVKVYKGSQYYEYASPMVLAVSRIAPVPQNVPREILGCQD